MRQGPGGRRSRGRHHGGNGGNNSGGHPSSQGSMGSSRPRSAASLRHQTFDSNGPEVRVRGNAWQVYEKYQTLARDASSSGDRVVAENLLQHAEHYYRIIEAINEATASEQRARGPQPQQFGQQPDMPSNYYTTDGQLAPPVNAAPDAMADGSAQPQPQAQAAVERRSPAATPFFGPEDTDDNASGTQPLVARR